MLPIDHAATADAAQKRAALRRAAIAGAIVAFVVSRVIFAYVFDCPVSDVGIYFDYAVQGVDRGITPYDRIEPNQPPGSSGEATEGEPFDPDRVRYRNLREFEYPPLAYWVMALPRQFSDWRLPQPTGFHQVPAYWKLFDKHLKHYVPHFRSVMLAFDAGGFLFFYLLLLRRRPELVPWGLWGYVVSTSLLWFTLLERLDVGLTFFVLGWAYCWLRADDGGRRSWLWAAAAYAMLGFGIAYKLIPVLLVPFALVYDAAQLLRRERDWRHLVGPVALVVATLAPFIYFYALVGNDLVGMFQFHSGRGVQIESTYATLMMLWEPNRLLEAYFDWGGWNCRGPLDWLADKATLLLLVVLAVLGMRWLASPWLGERMTRRDCYRRSIVVLPVAIALSKVFSPQYLAWGAPLLLLAGAEFCSKRGFIALVCVAIVLCGLTAFLFPFHYAPGLYSWPYNGASPPPWTLVEVRPGEQGLWLTFDLPRHVLTLRNLFFAGACLWLGVQSLRRDKTLPVNDPIRK